MQGVVLIAGIVLPIVALFMISGLRRAIDELACKLQSMARDLREMKEQAKAPPATKPAERSIPLPASAEIPAPPPFPVAAAIPQAPPAPKPPPPVRAPSPLAEKATEILRRMWNWIAFGEETRPRGVTLEYVLARTWLPRLGILMLVIGVGWLLQGELIGPRGRVAIGMLTGVCMLVWGMKLKGKQYDVIGQVLLGGGLLALYFSVYAAGPKEHVIASLPVVFGLMLLVTLTAGFLSVRTDSLAIAVIGLAGGYLTPVMLRTPTPNLPGLYSYILLLTLGVLGVAHRKQWRLLTYLAFVLTYALFFGSVWAKTFDKSQDFALALWFLSAYFVLHAAIVYTQNVLKGAKTTLLEVGHMAINAVVYGWGGYWLIREAYGRPYPALLTLALAVFFMAQTIAFLRRARVDRVLLVTLIALTGAFAAITLPLALEKETLTICLALLALMFLWIGNRIGSNFLQNAAYALYAVVFYRLAMLDLPRNFSGHPSAATPAAVYWKQMAGRLWTFGLSLASIAGAFLIQRRQPAAAPAIARENDTALLPRQLTDGAFYWFGILFAFLFLQLEINSMFMLYPPMRLPALTALWCAMAGYFLWRCTFGAFRVAPFVFLCLFVAGAVAKLFTVDLVGWEFDDRLIYNMQYSALYAGMRLMDFGLIMLVLFSAWRLLATREGRATSPVFGYAGLLVLFLYTSLELNSLLFWKLRGFQNGGISVLWALFAIAFVAGGIRNEVKTLRYIGLLLFVVVVGKVILVDLGEMEMIYRVAASMGVGLILLISAFAYIKAGRKLSGAQKPGLPDGPFAQRGG